MDRFGETHKAEKVLQITGLTTRQKVLCDIMWDLDSHENVDAFIATLPARDARDCRTLIEMMRLAFTDQIDSTDLAKSMLKDILK